MTTFIRIPYSPVPRPGHWGGFRSFARNGAREPLQLHLAFHEGMLCGMRKAHPDAADVVGVYGSRSGSISMLLTDAEGCAIEFEGAFIRFGITGTWTDDSGRAGKFFIWPRDAVGD